MNLQNPVYGVYVACTRITLTQSLDSAVAAATKLKDQQPQIFKHEGSRMTEVPLRVVRVPVMEERFEVCVD